MIQTDCLFLESTLEPPCWWKRKHPDDVMLWSTPEGETTRVTRWPEAWKERQSVSVASDLWRREERGIFVPWFCI